MPTPEVIALADEVEAHIERGDLAALAPIDLGPDGNWIDVQLSWRRSCWLTSNTAWSSSEDQSRVRQMTYRLSYLDSAFLIPTCSLQGLP